MTTSVKNYSTEVAAKKSVSEIQELLGEYGVRRIMIDYSAVPPFGQQPVGISFAITTRDHNQLFYQLPCRWEGTLSRLRNDPRTTTAQRTARHALNVAWRSVRMWIQSQLEFVASGHTDLAQAFFAYLLVPGESGEQSPLYEEYKRRYLLPLPPSNGQGKS